MYSFFRDFRVFRGSFFVSFMARGVVLPGLGTVKVKPRSGSAPAEWGPIQIGGCSFTPARSFSAVVPQLDGRCADSGRDRRRQSLQEVRSQAEPGTEMARRGIAGSNGSALEPRDAGSACLLRTSPITRYFAWVTAFRLTPV